MEGQENEVLIGSYTDGSEKHSVFKFNPNKQTAEAILSAINPSYVVCGKEHFYIGCENQEGEVITLSKGNQLLSRVSTMGSQPCHLSLDSTEKFLVVCNYGSGSVSVFELENNKPTKIRCFITHEGSSTNPDRQSSPHPHCSVFSECGSILFISDLGTDVIYHYHFSEDKIEAVKEKSVKLPGAGPRTLCKGKPGDKKLYATCELDNTLRVFSYTSGFLEQLVAYKLSENPENLPSEVCYHNGNVLVCLRGDDNVIMFDVNGDKLAQKLAFRTGKNPRNMLMTPYGLLYVACQKDNKVIRYLFKDEKILQIGELPITTPSVIALVP